MPVHNSHQPQTPNPQPPHTTGAPDLRVVPHTPDAPTLKAAASVWLPTPNTYLFSKGRVALYAILRAMDIGDGDEVLLLGYTCVVVPSAVAYTGAKPVYYDIDPNTYNGDPAHAQSRITNHTKAVIIQHTYGMPCESDDLIETCRRRGIPVIEDCAHAMGGALHGRPLGTLGDAAFASFQWSKPVTVGLGGVARVNNDALQPKLQAVHEQAMSDPSRVASLAMLGLAWAHQRFMTPRLYWSARALYHALGRAGLAAPSSTAGELAQPDVMPRGYCERFGDLRRRQLDTAMRRLPDTIAHSNGICDLYRDWCAKRGIKVQARPEGAAPVDLRFPVLARDRDSLLAAARRERIELGDWFNAPLHPDVQRASSLGFEPGTCPNAEHAARHVVNLPAHRRVDRDEANRILAFMDRHKELLQ